MKPSLQQSADLLVHVAYRRDLKFSDGLNVF